MPGIDDKVLPRKCGIVKTQSLREGGFGGRGQIGGNCQINPGQCSAARHPILSTMHLPPPLLGSPCFSNPKFALALPPRHCLRKQSLLELLLKLPPKFFLTPFSHLYFLKPTKPRNTNQAADHVLKLKHPSNSERGLTLV